MKKINLNTNILALDGKTIMSSEKEEWTMGKYLSRAVLANEAEGGMRKLILAEKLYDPEAKNLLVDASDMAIMKNSINSFRLTNNPEINGLMEGRAEIYLESLKEEEKEKPDKK